MRRLLYPHRLKAQRGLGAFVRCMTRMRRILQVAYEKLASSIASSICGLTDFDLVDDAVNLKDLPYFV